MGDPRLKPVRSRVLERAARVGVTHVVSAGTCPEDWESSFCESGVKVFCCVGVHPWRVESVASDWERQLRDHLTNSSGGVGEIGLDFCKSDANRNLQLHFFEKQLLLARELNRPVSIHCVQAWGPLLESIRKFAPLSGMVHAFAGSPELALTLQAEGLSLGFGGSVTRGNRKLWKKRLAVVARGRLLLESDSPDLAPEGWSAEFNEPASLPLVARCLEELGSFGNILQDSAENAIGIFAPKS